MNLIIAIVAFLSFAQAAEEPKKPAKEKPKLTKEEKELVERAEKIFKNAEKQPPPSKKMQDKMQSGVVPRLVAGFCLWPRIMKFVPRGPRSEGNHI